MAELELKNVSKIYPGRRGRAVKAVDDVAMTVNDGEIVALLGSSGCGKTSTLRMIAGFEDVTEGRIELGGRLLNDLKPAERGVAMAFEGYALYPPLSVYDNIAFALLRRKVPKLEAERRVREVASLLRIEGLLDKKPRGISAGQAQRVGLARALVRDADLHLFDEPMGQLEPQLRALLRAQLKDRLIERGNTAVFVTHDQAEAAALADRIAVMEGGVLQQYGSVEDLRERPANTFVAGFIGEPQMNLVPAAVEREGARVRLRVSGPDGGEAFALSLPAGDAGLDRALAGRERVVLGLRPNRLVLGGDDVVGEVVSNQWLGDQSHAAIEAQGVALVAVAEGAIDARVGERLGFTVPFEAVHLFEAEGTQRALLHGAQAGG